jgi:hypothetical protein
MQGWLGKIFEDEYKIKLTQSVLDTLQGRDFNVGQCDNKEGWFSEVHKALCSWLKAGTGSEGDALKG